MCGVLTLYWKVADLRTDSGSQITTDCGRGRGRGSLVAVCGQTRTENYRIRTPLVLTASYSADTDKTRRRNWLVNSHLSLCVFVGSWWFLGGSSRQQFHWQTGNIYPPLRTERHRWILRPPQDDLRSGKWFRRHFYVVKIFTSWW